VAAPIRYTDDVSDEETLRPTFRKNPYAILLGTLVLLLVVWPVLAQMETVGPRRALVHGALFTLLLLAIFHAVRAGGRRNWLWGLLVLALLGEWADGLIEGDATTVLSQIGAAVLLAVVTVFVVRRVFAPGQVTADRIIAALCAFLFMGMFWANLYNIVHIFDATAFGFPDDQAVHHTDFTYFSFVTLTTLGYGDIRPVAPIARSLAFMEATFGQLYIAVVVARLVALELVDARRE
jgi:hypothetical protein